MRRAGPARDGLGWRRLGPGDVAAVAGLHRCALARLADPGWVRPETPDFFAAVLGEAGFGLGIEADGRLIAYGLVQTRLEAEDAARLPWADAGGPPVAKLCGAAVHPDWRGRGLQAALASERLRQGRALGCGRFFATAAPGNVASWASLLRAGMQIAALGPRYGGGLRYTLVADDREAGGPATAVALSDGAGQAARLAAGWRGTGLRRGPPAVLEFQRCGG